MQGIRKSLKSQPGTQSNQEENPGDRPWGEQLDNPEKGRRQTQNFLNDNIDDDDHYFLLLHVQAVHTLSQFFFTKIP